MTVGDDVLDLPAVELSALLAGGALRSVALTDAYLARIERLQPGLNCFVTVTAERARADAARADAARADGTRGPLLGLPYALKDIIDTAGIATTWGTRGLLDRVPAGDAAVEARLRAAGAVLLGKLSLTELANTFGNNWPEDGHGGACRTPWDRRRWAGGSSSGAGSATAAGLCGFALGTETWGSIDCPAAFCGVTGLRPTYDVVSRTGVMTVSWTLDKVGVLGRDARDAAMVLGVIAEPSGPALSLERATPAEAAALRIGIVDRVGGPVPDPAYDTAWAAAKEVLRRAGVAMQPVKLPELPRIPAVIAILLGEAWAAFEPFIRAGHGGELYDREAWPAKVAAYRALDLRADDYVKATRVRAQIQQAYQAIFDEVDVLLGPGRPSLPPPVDVRLTDASGTDTFPALLTDGNAAGLPAVTFPMGFTAGGLPLSMHAVAAPYRDDQVLAVAALFQASTDHHRRRPPAT